MSEELNEKLNEKLREQSFEMVARTLKDLESLKNMDQDTRAKMTFEYYKHYRETCSDFLNKVNSIQNVAPAMFRITGISMICVSSDRLSTLAGEDIPTTACLGSPDNVAKLIMHLLKLLPEVKPLIKEQLNG